MVRLVLLLGPIASSLGGIAVANMLEWSYETIYAHLDLAALEMETKNRVASQQKKTKKKLNKKKRKTKNSENARTSRLPPVLEPLFGPVEEYFETASGKVMAKMTAGMILFFVVTNAYSFFHYSVFMAQRMSNPSLMYQAKLRDGSTIMIDDYREAYWWLRDNTPEDSRVMAWWDYGYQITGIGERTTIADGNTWNHEHIATLGRCLVSPEEEAHKIVRHLADYVLIWVGGGGDDLAKSPHMARISNSVYSDICPGDPTCRQFGFIDRDRTPKPMMAASLLYKLHSHNQRPGVKVNPKLFEEVYTSKYNKVRIFKVLDVDEFSKAWVPKNLQPDVPGSWYAPGQYPPAVQEMFKKWNKRNFKQLEDFNVERDEDDDEYHKAYMAAMEGRQTSDAKQKSTKANRRAGKKSKKGKQESNNKDNLPDKFPWQNTGETTRLWNLIHENDLDGIQNWIDIEPYVVHLRSEDGRGPLWWAYEHKRKDIISLLLASGADPETKDAQGMRPRDT